MSIEHDDDVDQPLPEAEEGDTSIYDQLNGLLEESSGDDGDVRLSGAHARRFEDVFMTSFLRRIRELPALPHPGEGSLYDLRVEKENLREWSEHEEARRHLMRAGREGAADETPRCRSLQITLARRALFGAPKPRVSVIASCWSPLEKFAKGWASPYESQAGLEVVDAVLERAYVTKREDVHHYLVLCSTTGWDSSVLDPLPEGANYSIALVEPRSPGWLVRAPDFWPPALAAAADPEDIPAKHKRVEALLRNSEELSAPGGLILIEELADHAVVPYELALAAAQLQCENDHDLVLERVEGSMIIRRRRVRGLLG